MKTAVLNCRLNAEDKTRLIEKAHELHLTLTTFLEKLAREPVVFLDKNSQILLEALKLKSG